MDDEFIISLCNCQWKTLQLLIQGPLSDLNEMQVKFINKKKFKKKKRCQFSRKGLVVYPLLQNSWVCVFLISGVCNQCPYLEQKRLFQKPRLFPSSCSSSFAFRQENTRDNTSMTESTRCSWKLSRKRGRRLNFNFFFLVFERAHCTLIPSF